MAQWLLCATIVGLAIWLFRERLARARLGEAASIISTSLSRDVVEGMPVGVLYCDANDRVVLWNAIYADMAGPAAHLLKPGIRFVEVLEEVERQGWVVEYADSEPSGHWLQTRLADRASGAGHREMRMRDGRWIRFEDRRTANGGIVLVALDVSRAKAREQSFQILYESNPIPMCIWDLQSLELSSANAAAETHYGWSPADVGHVRLADVLPEDEKRALIDGLNRSDGAPYESERPWRQRGADGADVFVLPRATRLHREDGDKILSAMVDITDRVLKEQELREQKAVLAEVSARAEAANHAKSEFLANMSHEIRTPLNGVIAVADVLSRTAMTEDQGEMVDLIRTSGETLNRLLSDILDLARIEAGRLTFEIRPFNLAQALNDVARLAEMRATEKGLDFHTEIAPEVNRVVDGDATRVKQIVTNLLSNAVKFTTSGSVRVVARLASEPDHVEIRVEDTGIGFSEASKAALFNRFQQADGSITRRFGGSGLGLSICRELATAMEGEIDCESSPGIGSIFVVRIRLAPSASGGRESAGEFDAIERPLRVLLADDHPANRQVASLVLGQVETVVTAVEDGEQAFVAFTAGAYDIVLMDMHMPVLDGLSATRAIRAFEAEAGRPRTPIIMLTANAAAEHVAASAAAGADMHLAKPFTALELLGAISQLADEGAPFAEVA